MGYNTHIIALTITSGYNSDNNIRLKVRELRWTYQDIRPNVAPDCIKGVGAAIANHRQRRIPCACSIRRPLLQPLHLGPHQSQLGRRVAGKALHVVLSHKEPGSEKVVNSAHPGDAAGQHLSPVLSCAPTELLLLRAGDRHGSQHTRG
eukprot:scaffold314042_cov40-Prasinocladus_malaysianus.AAC.1